MTTNNYHYDPETFIYSGQTDAALDPLQTIVDGTDVYLSPANSTHDEPLPPSIGENVVWNPELQEWEYQPV